MCEIRQDGDDLILVSKCCDEAANSWNATQLVEQLELVLDANRTAGNVDLLHSHIMGLPVHRFHHRQSEISLCRPWIPAYLSSS